MSLPKRPGKNEVFIMRPMDQRVLPLNIEKEEDLACFTEPVEDTQIIVWKHGPGWNKPDGGALFLSVEGMPVTTYINAAKEIVASTVEEFLRLIWTDEKYDRLQPELREPIETNNYAATVTVEPIEFEDEETKHTMDKVKATHILKESNLQQLKDFGVAEPEKNKVEEWMMRLFFGGFCAFLMYFLIKQGIV